MTPSTPEAGELPKTITGVALMKNGTVRFEWSDNSWAESYPREAIEFLIKDRAAILSYSQAETKRADQSDAVSAIDRAAFFKMNAELADTEKALEICNEALSDAQNQFIAYKAKYEAATAALDAAKREVETRRIIAEQSANRCKQEQDDVNDLLVRLGLTEDQFRTDAYFLNVAHALALLKDAAKREVQPKLVEAMAIAYIGGVMEHEHPEIRGQWQTIKTYLDNVAALAAKSTEPKEG